MQRSETGRITHDDVELIYELTGTGDPVVLIHASPFVGWYAPLVEQMPDFAVLRYHRRLHPAEPGRFRPLTVAEDAALCARVMDHVGWQVAHVAGHSYGALVALGLALDAPGRVRTLALLEPAARGISSSAQVVAALQPVIAAYRSGDSEAAMDGFLRTVGGDDYRGELDRLLPAAFAAAVAEADQFFQAEQPSVAQFSFGADDARRITQPVLNVLGENTVPRFIEASRLVQQWFPDAERFVLPGASHLLMVQNPQAMGDRLTEFYARHPIGAVAGTGSKLR